MSYKDKYKARDTWYNGSTREDLVRRNRDNFNTVIQNNSSYYSVDVIGYESKLDMMILDNGDTKDTKIFNVPYESSFKLGDTVIWKNDHWLAIHYDEMSEVYKRGILRKCLSTLRWLNADGEVKETWFTYSGESTSNFGIDEGRIISVDNDRRQIIVKNNSETSYFENETRFIFDNRAWKVTSIDRLNPDLIYMVLNADEINPAVDNIELRVADYIDRVASYEINVLSGNSLILSPNSPLQLQVEIRNRGVVVPSPTLSFTSADESIVTVDENGLLTPISEGLTSINAQFKDVQTVINIEVVQEQAHNYTVEIIDDSSNPFVIYRGRTKEFRCVFKDNGVAYDDVGVFSLATPSNIATITTQSSNRCVVQGNSIGKVILKVVGTHAETTKEITIKSII